MPSPNKNVIINGNWYYYWIYYPNSGGVSNGGPVNAGSGLLFHDYLSTDSVRTPNFRNLRRSALPINNYAKEVIWTNDPRATFAQTVKTGGGTYNENYSINAIGLGAEYRRTFFPSTEADDPTQRVISLLAEQIRLGKANTAVTFAEAHKTAAHVAHTATRIYKAISALKKGRFGDFSSALGLTYKPKELSLLNKRYQSARKGTFGGPRSQPLASRLTDFASDTWLEYSYGWKPLLYDVYQHAEAFATAFTEHQGVIREARARQRTQKNSLFDEYSYQKLFSHVVRSQKWYEMSVSFKIPAGTVDTSNVFGLQNPMIVAWELVPFSFVADWFIPIGTALEAVTSYNGLVFHHGYRSIRHLYEHTVRVKPGRTYVSPEGYRYTCTGSSAEVSHINLGISRVKLTDFPQYGWPTFKDPRSFSHAASAVALLQSLFLRK